LISGWWKSYEKPSPKAMGYLLLLSCHPELEQPASDVGQPKDLKLANHPTVNVTVAGFPPTGLNALAFICILP